MVGVDPGGPLITAVHTHASACCPGITPVPVACLLPQCRGTADDFPVPIPMAFPLDASSVLDSLALPGGRGFAGVRVDPRATRLHGRVTESYTVCT